MRQLLKYVSLLTLILLGISFACLNAKVVSMNIYVKTVSLPLSLLLALTLIAGVLLGFIVSGFKIFRLYIQNKSYAKRLTVAEKEVKNLRSIPFGNEH